MSVINNLVSRRPFYALLIALVGVLLVTVPLYSSPYALISLSNIFMYIIVTVSWAVFSGPTGYISLASAAFFGIGIYVSAVIGTLMPFPLVIAAGGVLSFLVALLVGLSSLRLRGMYFTIFTFGLSELIRHSVHWWEVNMTGTVGRWVVAIDQDTVFYVMLIILLITLLTAFLIDRSRLGFALRGIGESEEAADHMGVHINAAKTIAFAIGSFFMGAAGAVMATQWTYIDPSIAFNPLFSFMPVLMAIFGGIGKVHGQIVGATVLTLLADVLLTKFPYYYMLLYGVILVVVVLFLPQGLVALWGAMKEMATRGYR
jgi:branched-chain amino acid transport system permease protein